MKKIILLSDTHGHIDEAMLDHIENDDDVWHADDIWHLDDTYKIKELAILKQVYFNIYNQQNLTEFHKDQHYKI